MRDVRAKKSNRSRRTWVLVSAAGLAQVVGGSFAVEAVTAAHANPAQSGAFAAASPNAVASASGNQTSTDPTSVPDGGNDKPWLGITGR
ncbi:hypothetical protein [Streptomyces sp. NPDC059597]|uniref:hypothetical protein n=1 Tax=Streptomyces sp. NPDC059597 TaxID=3346879 RepID=UPI00367D4AE0